MLSHLHDGPMCALYSNLAAHWTHCKGFHPRVAAAGLCGTSETHAGKLWLGGTVAVSCDDTQRPMWPSPLELGTMHGLLTAESRASMHNAVDSGLSQAVHLGSLWHKHASEPHLKDLLGHDNVPGMAGPCATLQVRAAPA